MDSSTEMSRQKDEQKGNEAGQYFDLQFPFEENSSRNKRGRVPDNKKYQRMADTHCSSPGRYIDHGLGRAGRLD